MCMRPGCKLFYIVTLLFMLNVVGVFAQVSLLPEHTITVKGVTLLRDCRNAGRWYYVPERPSLLERNPSSKTDPRPVFQLVTYQAKQDSKLYEGGVLQFSVSMHLSEEKRKDVLAALKKHPDVKNQADVSLAPLPYHKAEAILFDASGKLNASGTNAPGIAPAFVTGALPFQLKLDKFDADLYEALVDAKNSGVGVLMNLTFAGQLPPAGFKVTINWEQTWKFLSSSKETKISLGNYYCGIDIGISKKKIREELISNGCMTVESLTNDAVSNAMLDRYLDPVVARMQETLIAKIHPPERIDTESRNKADSLNKCFFVARTSVSVELKNINECRKGSETFEFNQSVIVDRKTACGAFIGINAYSQEVKDKLVRTMAIDSWASAFLMLPSIQNSPELNITSVSMTANVVDADGKAVSHLSDTATWSADRPYSWIGSSGSETGSLKFPLMSLFKEHDNDIKKVRQSYSFKVDVVIGQKLSSLNSLSISYNSPMFDGNLPLPAAIDLVDNIIFDFSSLTFSSPGLKKVKISVKKEKNGDKLDFSFPQRGFDEQSVVFIVAAAKEGEEKPEKLIPTIAFDSSAKRDIKWEQNGKDLREIEPSLYFMFFDSDWEPKPTAAKPEK